MDGLWLFCCFWAGRFFWVEEESDRSIDRVRLGLKNSLKNIVDGFFTWMTQFFIHVKVACGLCHGFFDLDDHSFLPLEFCVSGKKFNMAPIASRKKSFSSCSSHRVTVSTSLDCGKRPTERVKNKGIKYSFG